MAPSKTPSRSRKTRTHSTVLNLPPEVRAAIEARLDAGDTYDAITAHLHAMGHAVSRSAVSRWGQDVTARQLHLEAAADLARLLTEKLSPEQLEEAATLLALGLVVNALMQHDELATSEDGLYLPHVTQLISALARVSSANLAREKWRVDIERKAREAAEAVAGEARSAGLSDAVCDEIRKRILGIPEGIA